MLNKYVTKLMRNYYLETGILELSPFFSNYFLLCLPKFYRSSVLVSKMLCNGIFIFMNIKTYNIVQLLQM